MATSSVPGPNPIEIQEFQFKLFSRLRIFPEESTRITLSDSLHLVTTSSKYGLLFVATPNGFQVLQSSEIIKIQENAGKCRNELSEFPRREVLLGSQPTHLSVSSDSMYLAVIFPNSGCQIVRTYLVSSFFSQSIQVTHEVRASSTDGVTVSGLSWNPGVPDLLAVCFSDGSVSVYTFKEVNFTINSLPPNAQATCLCWSPKGKQIVVGSSDGALTQYKPELKAVKKLPPPNMNQHNVSVVNVQWLSNYQFAVIYRDMDDSNERPALMLVNAPKNVAVSYINYEDICYGSGNIRAPQFYLEHIQQWNVLVVGSANSMEVGVLGCVDDKTAEKVNWQQWVQEDASRAELPLTKSHQETFPVGLAFDTSVQYNLPWGENQQLPPMPLMCLYSHDGVLCLYFTVNILPTTELLCSPPQLPADQSGLQLFTNMASVPKPIATSEPVVNVGNSPAVQQPPVAQVTPFKAVTGGLNTSGGGLQITPNIGAGLQMTPNTTPFSSTPSQLSWMTPPSALQTPENPKENSSGIENITPPSQTTSVPSSTSLFGGSSLFGGTGGGGLLLKNSQQQLQQQQQQQQQHHQQQLQQQQQQQQQFQHQQQQQHHHHQQQQQQQQLQQQQQQQQLQQQHQQQQQQQQQLQQQHQQQLQQQHQQQHQQQQQVQSSFSFNPVNPPTNLFGSSTPISKAFVPPTAVAANLSNNSNTPNVIPSVAALTGAPLVTPPLLPLQVTQPPPNVSPSQGSPKVPMYQHQSPPASPTISQKNASDISQESLIMREEVVNAAIVDEVAHFDAELKEVFSSFRNMDIMVGETVEKVELNVTLEQLEAFWKEAIDNTNAQKSEVDTLKNSMLETFCWIEDAKARDFQRRNPGYKKLVYSQELDPVSKHRMDSIKQYVFYISNQLDQANRVLDDNWLLHEDKKKALNKHGLNIAPREELYQTLVIQNNVISKHKAVIEHLRHIIRQRSQRLQTQRPLIKVNDKRSHDRKLNKGHTELSALAENLLQVKLMDRNVANPRNLMNKERLINKSNPNTYNVTEEKKNLLRQIHSDVITTVPNIRVSRPFTIVAPSGVTSFASSTKTTDEMSPGKQLLSKFCSSSSFAKFISPDVETDTPKVNTESDTLKPVELFKNENNSRPFSNVNISGKPSDSFVIDNQPKENQKPVFQKANDNLVKPTFVQSPFASASSKPETNKNILSNKENIPNNSFPSLSLTKTTTGSEMLKENSGTSENMFKVADKPIPTPVEQFQVHDQNKSPLLSMTNIVAAVGSDTATKMMPFTPQSKPSGGLFSSNPLNIKGSNQEDSKPGTIFGAAFNKSQEAAKQNIATTDSSKSKATTTAFSTNLFGNLNLASNTSNTSFPGSVSFEKQDNSENKTASILDGKSSQGTTPVAFDLKQTSVFGTPSSTQEEQPKDTPKTDSSDSEKQKLILDQQSSPNKVGSIFGGGASNQTSATGSTFSFGAGKSLFGGSSTTTAQTGFVFGGGNSLSSSTPVTTKDEPKSVESTFHFSLPPTTVSAVPSTTSSSLNTFSFASPASTSAQPAMFSLASSWGASTKTSTLSTASSNIATTAAVTLPIVSTSAATPLIVSQPDSNSPGVLASPPLAKQEVLDATLSTTTAEIPKETDNNNEPAADVAPDSTPTESAAVSEAVSSVTSTTSTENDKSEKDPNSNVDPASALNSFSFSKLAVSSSAGTVSTTTTVASEFSFAQVLSVAVTTADFGSKMSLTFGAPTGGLGTSLFGGSTSQPTSIFGQTAQSTASTTPSSTPFTFSLSNEPSQPAAASTTSFFGGKSLFGSSAPAATTTAATTTTATPSFFGQPVSTPASTTPANIFGQSLTPNQAPFGQMASQQPAGFGTPPAFGSKATFGQSGGSLFGQSPSFGASSNSVFGGSPVFGTSPPTPNTPQTGGLFQSPGSGSNIFGARTNTPTSPGGSFSTGGQTISQTGFGPPAGFQQQNKPGGFGASPTFGAPPSFGGASTLAFGSPNKVFGTTAPTFATGTQQSTTFENLANQNTMSFGNLAQNQAPGFGDGNTGSSLFGTPQTTQSSAFPPSPSFGGNSFSNWR